MKKLLLLLAAALLFANMSMAQGRKAVDYSTDIAMFLPAAVGAGLSLYKGDYEGLVELGKTVAISTAVTYILKYSVKKSRPDGSGFDAFPSNHNNFAFAGATFLMRRYGWKWGVPAYIVGGYVAWGRIYAGKHDIWDVLAGAAIGVGSGLLFTTPFAKKHNVTLAPTITSEGGCGVYFSMSL
ncbi:MAG: phosphatase PAP2 family protein [Bacteroidaceae bacterium]|nr:phosphatase PAP2 family protein [Bacteroidaceae bacterium]